MAGDDANKSDLLGDSSSDADTDDLIAAAKSQPIARKKDGAEARKKPPRKTPDADAADDDSDFEDGKEKAGAGRFDSSSEDEDEDKDSDPKAKKLGNKRRGKGSKDKKPAAKRPPPKEDTRTRKERMKALSKIRAAAGGGGEDEGGDAEPWKKQSKPEGGGKAKGDGKGGYQSGDSCDSVGVVRTKANDDFIEDDDDDDPSSGSSSTLSSESPPPSGFPFNGTVYPTYQEMVAAKRERNHNVLQKSLDELSAAFGKDFGGSKKSDNGSRKSNNKRKRRPSNQSVGASVQSLRRNPTRCRGTTSSISTQSNMSSSCPSRRISCLKIPVPLVPPGQRELREACPQIGPGWIMRVRARNKVSANGPVSDRVFISPAGKIIRALADVERYIEGEPTLSGTETDGGNSVSFCDASSVSAGQSRRTADATPHNPMQKMAPKTTSKELSGSVTIPEQILLPKSVMVKDMSADLEHLLLTGGRVQAREGIWRDFLLTNSKPSFGSVHAQCKSSHATEDECKRKSNSVIKEGAPVSTEKERLIHLSDWKLYHPITAQSDHDHMDIVNSHSGDSRSFIDDDSDIVIPDDYMMENETTREPDKDCYGPLRGPHPMFPETLSPNGIVKYNNIIRENHSYYTSKGPDCDWDREFGDGVDPMMFAEECCAGNATDSGGGMYTRHTDGGIAGPEGPRTSEETESERYTSSLLQRCWDRAVHAASSTVAVPPTTGDQEGLKTTLGANKQILHSKAMNVVGSILDALFASDSGINLRQSPSSGEPDNTQVDWRQVLNCLHNAARQREKREDQMAGFSSIIQANGNRCPTPLNHISLKALSMRLIERYGTPPHKMPL